MNYYSNDRYIWLDVSVEIAPCNYFGKSHLHPSHSKCSVYGIYPAGGQQQHVASAVCFPRCPKSLLMKHTPVRLRQ